jgi:hypothetical protein
MKKGSRLFLIIAMIFAFSVVNLSPAFADMNSDLETQNLMPQFTLFAIGYGYLVQKYSPISTWENEIDTLTEDQRFLERWMLINTDPTEVQRIQKLIEEAEQEKILVKKKMTRFKRWFYPVVTLVGTGGIFLIERLFGESK